MATEHVIDPSTLDPQALAVNGEIFSGIVGAELADELAVLHEGRSILARRASSCLLVPAVGDRVLIARVEQRVFVLAVLERGTSEHVLEVDGDLRLRARGTVTVEADRDLRLRATEVLSATGRSVALAAKSATWVAERVEVVAEHLSLDATRLRQAAHYAETIAESMKETLGRSYREIREGEHVSADSMTLSLRNALFAHAENAIVTAKKLVKLNADQIHLG
jgi:hypothetical protein